MGTGRNSISAGPCGDQGGRDRAFAVREQERGLRPSGVNGCLRALKAMLSYFVREDVLTASPIKHVRLVREPKALIAVYSDTRLLFPSATAGFWDLRWRSILRLQASKSGTARSVRDKLPR